MTNARSFRTMLTRPFSLARSATLIASIAVVLPFASVSLPLAYADPIGVEDCGDLQLIGSGLAGSYVQVANIDCTGIDFNPIGDESDPFTGSYDGNGYVISNLTINKPLQDRVGLFGSTDGSTLSNVSIISGSVTGVSFVGGLVGYNDGNVFRSVSSATVESTGGYVGGLVGLNYDGGVINDSYATASVHASSYYVGGLVGQNRGAIQRAYASGDVSGGTHVGGLVGRHLVGSISDSFALGRVTSGSGEPGGLVGESSMSLYSSIFGTISNSYWSNQLSGASTCYGDDPDTAEETDCADTDGGLSYFYDPSDSPLDTFDYSNGEGFWFSDETAVPVARTLAPIGYWPLDEDPTFPSSTPDLSGNSQTLSMNGSPYGDVTERASTNFDNPGSNYFSGEGYFGGDSDYTALNITDSFSISFWAKTDPGPNQPILGKFVDAQDANYEVAYQNGTYAFSSDEFDGESADLSLETAVHDGDWHLVTWTYDGNLLKGYLDGQLDAQSETMFVLGTGLSDFYLGYDGVDHYSAYLDDVRIYDYPLADAAIEEMASHLLGTCDDLASMQDDLEGLYSLTSNIDCASTEYAPIGDDDSPFMGTFDGGGHVISNLNMTFSGRNTGLFGVVGPEGYVRRIGIVSGTITSPDYRVGSIAGVNVGTIDQCFSWADVSTDASYAGGIVAQNFGTVSNCYATGDVSSPGGTAGGIVSQMVDGTVSDSYFAGTVTGGAYAGGIVSIIDDGTIENVFATGSVSYATFGHGGIVGQDNGGTFSNASWSIASTGQDVCGSFLSAGCDDGAYQPSDYVANNVEPIASWNDNYWVSSLNNQYPQLIWEAPVGYYRFDGPNFDGDEQDASWVGNDLTPIPEEDVPSYVSDAGFTDSRIFQNEAGISFDGTSQYFHRGFFNYVPTSNLTVCTWLKTTGSNEFVMQQGRDDEDTEYVFRVNADGKMHFWDYDGGAGFGLGDPSNHSDTAVNDGAWHNVCFVKDHLQGTYYVDGEENGTVTAEQDNLYSGDNFAVAYDYRDGMYYFDGKMDDMRVYDRTLSSVEIASLIGEPPAAVDISTCDDLIAIGSGDLGGDYVQTQDIDCAGKDYVPVGNYDTPFTGTYDGGGHIISGIHFDPVEPVDNVGVFGAVGEGGVVENVGVIDSMFVGGDPVGGLVGSNAGTLRNCFADASVEGASGVGGLVGTNESAGIIANCYAKGTVKGDGYTGGFVGYADGTIEKSYAASLLVSVYEGESGHYIGGFVGYVDGAATITDSMSAIPNDLGFGETHGQFAGNIDGGATIDNDWYANDGYPSSGFGGGSGVGLNSADATDFYVTESDKYADWDFSEDGGRDWVSWGNTFPVLAWQDPLVYWKMGGDNGAGSVANTNGDHPLTIHGDMEAVNDAPVTDVSDIQSLSFNGDDQYLSADDSFLPTGTGSRTISLWFKTTVGHGGLLNYGTNSGNQQYYIALYNGNDCTGDVTSTGDAVSVVAGTNGAGSNVCSDIAVADGRWHNVTTTYDGATHRIYLDGELQSSRAQTMNTVSGGEVTVGRALGQLFDGAIDDVRVYDHALTEAEIMTMAKRDSVGHWSLDEGEGAVAHDGSANGNDATVSFSDLWTSDTAPVTFSSPYALSFGADNEVAQAATTGLPTESQPRSIGGWVYKTANGTSGAAIPFAYGDCDMATRAFGVYINNENQVVFWGCAEGDFETGVSISENEWHYIAATYDGTYATVYIDGVLAGTYGRALDTGTTALAIGGDGDISTENNYNFVGSVDDVRVYDYVLSWGQVQNLSSRLVEPQTASFVTPPTPVDEATIEPDESATIQVETGDTGPQSTVMDFDGTLRAWWTFNDNDLSDSSTYENALTNHGATYTADGYFGGALSFDGESYLDAGTTMPTGSYTKSAWIKIASFGANNNILSGDSGHAFWASCGGNHLGAGHNEDWCGVQDPEVLQTDAWYHVAVTFDYQTDVMKLYKNGVEVASATQEGINDNHLYIGAFGESNYFDGVIDDPQIYDRALSGGEIAALYDSSGPNVLVGYWPLNDVDSEEDDSSGYANSGQTTSAPSTNMGKYGNARTFNGVGDQTIDVNPEDTSLYSPSATGALSVSWWAMIPVDAPLVGEGGAGNQGAYFITKTGGPDSAYEWGVENERNTQACFSQWNADAYAYNCGYYPFNEGNGNDGQFHLYTFVLDNGTGEAALYIDGTLVTSAMGGGFHSTTAGLIIGSRAEKSSIYSFTGTIDDVRIYHGVLGTDDMEELAAANVNGSPYVNVFSGLQEGSYDYVAYMQNEGGGVASTETRTLNVAAFEPGDCSPALFWSLDEGEGIIANDSSGNGIDGEIFAGEEPIWSTDTPTLDGSNPYSLEFTGGTQGVGFSKETGANYTFSFWMKSSGGNGEGGASVLGEFPVAGLFYTDDAEGGGHLVYPAQDGPGTMNDSLITVDQWHHVAVVIRGDFGTYYVDGEEDGTFSDAQHIDPNHFGGIGGEGFAFHGKLDDLRIYDSALNGSQVAELAGGAASCTGGGDEGGGMCAEAIHYWPFEEGAGSTTADATGDIDGLLQGIIGHPSFADEVPSALSGSTFSLRFDAVDNESVDFDPIALNDSFTMSLWVKTSGAPTGYTPLFTNENDIGLNLTSGYKLDFYDGDDDFETTSALTEGVWHHVALVRDGTALTFYIDGTADVLEASSAINLSITRMGSSEEDSDPFNGYIDEAKIYDFALDAGQIAALAEGSTFACDDCGELDAHWTFDEGEGAPDSSGNGHHGTLATDGETYPSFSDDVPDVGSDDLLSLNFTDASQGQRVNMSMPVASEFTISMWIKAPEEGVTNENHYSALMIQDNDIGLYYMTNSSDTPNSLNWWHDTDHINSTPLGTAAWHHVALVNGGSGATFYVDGVAGDTVAAFTDGVTFDSIGGDTSGNNFLGKIDDVYVYGTALSAGQIATLADGREVSSCEEEEVTWTGAESTDWSDADNWDTGVVPGDADNVRIADDGYRPVLDGVNPEINDLTIEEGATLSQNGQMLTVNGTFENHGTLILNGNEGEVPHIPTNDGTVMYTDSGEGGFNAGTDYHDLTINDGLVGYWKFEDGESSVVRDSSGYENNGGFEGGVWESNFDAAPPLSFENSEGLVGNGEGYVSVDNPSRIPVGNDLYSISAWIYADSMGSKGIVGWGTYGPDNETTAFRLHDEGLDVYWFGNDMVANVGDITHAWHHVLTQFDGTTRTIYMDGKLVASDLPESAPMYGEPGVHSVPDARNFAIGRTYPGEEYFDGMIDDVRIYDRPLSENEIAALASGNQPATGEDMFTLHDNFDIRGDFTLNGGGFDMNDYDVSLGGSWINNGGIVYANGEVTLDGSETNTILSGGQSFGGVTTDGEEGVWVAADALDIDARLAIGEDDLIDANGYPMHLGYLENDGALLNDVGTVTYDRLSSHVTDFSDGVMNASIESPAEAGMVGYWKFDEGNGDAARDATGNGHQGTVSEGAFHRSERIGDVADLQFDNPAALEFTVDDQGADLGNGEDFDSGTFTISTWVNISSFTNSAIVSKTRTSGSCTSWDLSVGEGNLVFAATTADSSWQLDTPSLSPDEWYNVIVTYDQETGAAIMYLNGHEVDASDGPVDPPAYSFTSNMIVGASGESECAKGAFDGSVDDLRFYNVALGTDAIAQLSEGNYATGMNGEGTATYSLDKTAEPQSLAMVSGALDKNDHYLIAGSNLFMYGGTLLGDLTILTVRGNVNLLGGTLIGSNYIYVYGDWYRLPSATFVPGEGVVFFLGDEERNIVGDTTFHNLTFETNGPVNFQGGSTTTIEGLLNMTHSEGGDHLVLRSMDSDQWYIDPQGAQDVSYVDVESSFNIHDEEIDCTVHCIDSGDNVAWLFTPVACGNGYVEEDEQCDDGDTDGGDGCSATCGVETKWYCSEDEPSACFETAAACTTKAYYAFDALSGDTTPDASGNGFTGTIHGGVTLSNDVPSVRSGTKSYAFDGESGYVEADRPVMQDMSICAWIKTEAVGNGDGFDSVMPIVSADVGGYYTYDYGFGVNSDGTLTFGFGYPIGETDQNLVGSIVVNTGEWTHVCGTRSAQTGEVRLYVNGGADGNMFATTNALDMSDTIRIGYGNEGNDPAFWNGNIADVRIYEGVLDQSDIQSIYEGTLSCPSHSSSSSSSSFSSERETRAGGGGGGGGRTTGTVTGGQSSGVPATPVREHVKASIDGKAQVFRDVWTDDWFGGFVKKVAELGIFSGYKDQLGRPLGKFGPADPITLGQLAKVAAIVAGNKVTETPGEQWALPYLENAKAKALAVYLEKIDENAKATRGQVIQTLLEALGIPLDKPEGLSYIDVRRTHRFYAAIETATRLGIVAGDDGKGTFRPNDPVNRAEVAKMIVLALEKK